MARRHTHLLHHPIVVMDAPLLSVADLTVHFAARRDLLGRVRDVVHAVDGLSFELAAGRTVALVGESGSGKTTVARAVLGLAPVTGGAIRLDGVDLAALPARQRRKLMAQMQVVFQDPYSSLSPRMTVHDIVAEPLRARGVAHGATLEEEVARLLDLVGLGTQHLWRRPHEFSGGQCQRIAIARALALGPRLLILDEPTSALDVSVQARILVLLARLQAELGVAYLFVSHDLAVVRSIADDVVVMYCGRVAERGAAETVLATPRHPYTVALLASIPSLDPACRNDRYSLAGDVPSATDPPAGCRFHPRCPYRMDVCVNEEPKLLGVGAGRQVACHLPADAVLDPSGMCPQI